MAAAGAVRVSLPLGTLESWDTQRLAHSALTVWMLVVPVLLPMARSLQHIWHSSVSHTSHPAVWETRGCESAHRGMKQAISQQLSACLGAAGDSSSSRTEGSPPRFPRPPLNTPGKRLEMHVGDLRGLL